MTTALFVCVHNAGRSQMAAAIFNSLTQRLGIPLSAESAGTEPSDRVHPNVVSVMDEWGIDLSQNRPQALTNDMAANARRVITMGCEVDEAACPALFLKDIEDWGLPDPASKGVDETREIREEIYRRALGLILAMPEAAGHRELLTKLIGDCD
jgi:arsenate reductase